EREALRRRAREDPAAMEGPRRSDARVVRLRSALRAADRGAEGHAPRPLPDPGAFDARQGHRERGERERVSPDDRPRVQGGRARRAAALAGRARRDERTRENVLPARIDPIRTGPVTERMRASDRANASK